MLKKTAWKHWFADDPGGAATSQGPLFREESLAFGGFSSAVLARVANESQT
jgi:hypothetical protein